MQTDNSQPDYPDACPAGDDANLPVAGGVRVTVHNRFGDPKSALQDERYDLLFSAAAEQDQYYRPPIPFAQLVRMMRVNPRHGSLPAYRANQVVKDLLPNKLLRRETLRQVVVDDQCSGNGFFQLVRNRGKQVEEIRYQAMINTRRAIKPDIYGWLNPATLEFTEYQPGEILHLKEHDPAQQIYGVPHWIGALQHILLSEDIAIYPRLFFRNGGSTGDLILTSGLSTTAQEVVETTLEGVSGDGRFKRIVLQLPSGDIDKIFKVLPYSTGSDKIDYSKLAAMASKGILNAWQVNGALLGDMTEVPGGAGDLDKIKQADYEIHTRPIQQRYADALNALLPRQHWVQFSDPYENGNQPKD